MGMSLRGRQWVESIPLSINNTYGSGKYQKDHSYPRDGCIAERLVMPCILPQYEELADTQALTNYEC